MVDRDVVVAKTAAIDRCLSRIAEVRARRERMEPEDYEDVVEVNLQRAAQDAIDLAAHVVASEGWGVVDHVAQNFAVLEDHAVVDAELAARLRAMVGFRNIAVHHYHLVDPEVVESIVAERLDDLRGLCAAVVSFFGLR